MSALSVAASSVATTVTTVASGLRSLATFVTSPLRSAAPIVTAAPPSAKSLYEHQQRAVKWAAEREATPHYGIKGGILYLEMGLGKTLIGLTIGAGKGNLIVVPKSLIPVWKEHLTEWFPDRVAIYYHKDHMDKRDYDTITFEEMKQADIVITTYDVLVSVDRRYEESDAVCIKGEGFMQGKVIEVTCRKRLIENSETVGDRLLYKINWTRVIADESHKFCNHTTKTYRAMMAVSAEYRWALTGTLIRNKDTDLWSMLRFVGYNRCPASKAWNERMYTQHHLSTVILQMDYAQADIVLPERIDHEETYSFEPREREAYNVVRKRVIRAYNGMLLGNVGVNYIHVLALFTRLRQMCVAPYLITPQSKRHYKEGDVPVDEEAARELNEATSVIGLHDWINDREGSAGMGSSKIAKVLEIIRKVPVDEKIIIFSSFTSGLDLVSDAIYREFGEPDAEEGDIADAMSRVTLTDSIPPFHCVTIDGDSRNRQELIHLFKTVSNCRVMLTSYTVGGEGHQLSVANHVINLDPWWTNAKHKQAASRIHRNGQEKVCHVYNLIATDSIEDQMVKVICENKEEIGVKYFGTAAEKAALTARGGGNGRGIPKEMMGKILGM